jgi:HAD superfamily hydrolase (TIGR01549 family)
MSAQARPGATCSMIRAVVFDCFGVLCSDDLYDAFVTATSGDAHKQQQFYELCRAADYGEINAAAFWQEIAQLMDLPLDVCRERIDQGRQLNLELLQYIREDLKGAYKIGMLSNACDDIWEYVTPDIRELFDAIAVSSDIRRCKPDLEAYLEICRRLGVAPEEVVFIDDRLSNCIGAQQAGMRALEYRSFTQVRAELSDALVVV